MSVIAPIIASINGLTRRIYLKEGVSDYFPINDLYHEYRNLRRNDEGLRKFEPLLEAQGNVPKGGGAFTPRYVVLLDGTKIVPFDESLQVNQLGDMITDDPDTDASLYDISGLTTAKPIFIKPSEAETIQLNSESIEYSSFQNGVWIDSSTANTGIDFPNGSREYPVNNGTDAIAIANNRGFDKLYIIGSYTFTSGHNIDRFTLEGQNAAKSVITIDSEANAALLELFEAHVVGVLDGGSTLRECLVDNLNYVNGFIHQCILNPGTITLGGNNTAFIMDSFSGVAGEDAPTIDLGGSGQGLAMRNYSGGIKLANKSGADEVSIDLLAGQVILENTVTNGVIVVRGNGKVVDTEGNHILSGLWNGGVTVVNETPSVLHQHTLDTISTAVWGHPTATQLAEDISLLDKAVHIDTEQLTNGNGSQENPFNSLGSALDYAENRGLKLLHVLADITIDRNLKNFVITGIGTPAIDCNGHNLDKSEFTHCAMKGSYSGVIIVQESILHSGFYLNGFFENSVLSGDLFCVDGSKVLIKNCASFIQGTQQPSVSMVALGTCELGVRFYSGGFELRDLNHALDKCSLEPNAGAITLANSCTIGTGLSLKGVGTLANNSSILDTDIDNQLLNPSAILDEIA